MEIMTKHYSGSVFCDTGYMLYTAEGEMSRVWREIRGWDEDWQQTTESETWDGISAGKSDAEK